MAERNCVAWLSARTVVQTWLEPTTPRQGLVLADASPA
jgi:hypothetical protein